MENKGFLNVGADMEGDYVKQQKCALCKYLLGLISSSSFKIYTTHSNYNFIDFLNAQVNVLTTFFTSSQKSDVFMYLMISNSFHSIVY
jgi:hypothetical protein